MFVFSDTRPSGSIASGLRGRGRHCVLTSELTLAQARAYDQFVATAPSAHYSQTRAWARVATAGKPFTSLYFLARENEKTVGAALVLRTCVGGFALPFAQVERGPVTADPEALAGVLAALRRHCLARGIVRLSVMPYWTDQDKTAVETLLQGGGFADRQRFAGRHARTLRLDLDALDSEKPLSGSSLAKIRQKINRAHRAGATARPGRREDLAAFRQMHASQLALEGKQPPAPDWYEAIGDYFLKPGSAVFVAEVNGAVISAVFIALHNGVATFVMGASAEASLPFSNTVLSMTEAILWAKRAGAHTFDLGGMPLEGDPDPKRASIAQFKLCYSRTDVLLTHEHVRWF